MTRAFCHTDRRRRNHNPSLAAPLAALAMGLLVLPPAPARAQAWDWEVWGNADGLTLDQDMDLGPTEFVDALDVTGQGAGMEFSSSPGIARTGVTLLADLPPDYERNDVLGLARISAGVVAGPDAGCTTPHLVEGSLGGGIFIDGQGPFFELDPDGCGYGEVVETYSGIEGGGTPVGAGPDPDGIYVLSLRLTDELEPGEHHLTVTAQIGDTLGGAGREVTAPLTLLVPEIGALMSDDFESGNTSAWSVTVQ